MPDDLAALIRDRRHELGLTQAQLAELVGRAPSTIGSWERGRSRPSDEATVEALVRVLDLDAVDATERSTPPPPPVPEPTPAPPRAVPPAPEPDTRTAPSTPVEPAPVSAKVVVPGVRDALPAHPVRTDTDPLYRIRLVATVVAVVVLGWVFAASIEAAAEILGSITEAMLAPFRA